MTASATALSRALDLVKQAATRGLTDEEADHVTLVAKSSPEYKAKIGRAINDTNLTRELASLGRSLTGDPVRDGGRPVSQGLHAALQSAGFDPKTKPFAELDFEVFRMAAAATFDGDYENAVVRQVPAPSLGSDTRFLYPSLPTQREEPDSTGVQSFRQKARTAPSLSSMIRDIDAVTEKPEVGTEAELVDEPLHQIAAINKAIPNVFLASERFRSWINADLSDTYSRAVDAHVLAQVAAVTPTTAPAGFDLLESIVNGIETVAAAGYSASVLAASPETLIDLMLLKQPISGDYVFSGSPPPLNIRRVAVTGLATPYVFDPAALGTLHVTPVTLRAFEENSGRTNSTTVRIESHGVFVVQRVGAVAEVDLGGSA